MRDVVVGDRPDHEWAGDARVRDVLAGLLGGLDAPAYPNGLDTVVDGCPAASAGGSRWRALLVGEPDLLVLDEPTNHLDVEGIAWLAAHLRARRSRARRRHPRPLVPRRGLHARRGRSPTARCTRTTAATRRTCSRAPSAMRVAAAPTEERRQNLLRKELAWLRRGPPARTSKPQFRIDAANALIADEPPARDDVELVKFATARLGKTVYEVEDADVAVGVGTPGEQTLFRDLTWRVGPGDRIGVVGVNGAGKTTLLRLLLGELAAGGRPGRARRRRCAPALLTQVPDDVDPALRVLEAVSEVRASRHARQGQGDDARASCSSGSASPASGSGRRSATCPAASGAGCS